MNKNNNSFMFYPEITDNDFNQKIYEKKEFRDTEVKEKVDYNKIEYNKKEFTLEPHQVFLKNYISPDTPYNGILVFHQTGVGKTCTAISIAEGFKKTLKNMNKKILVLSTLQQNFKEELYSFYKERIKKNPEDIVQCTGKAYELGEESIYLTQQQKEREVYKLKKSYYQFFGYKKFANHITDNTGGWKGEEELINEKIKKFISKEFDDRVIIIDEIQNIKTDNRKELKSVQPILQSIIKYGKNIKLILMSATPMFDRPDEIIFYINLLLQNDGRETINKNEIFNKNDGTLKLEGEKKLRNAFKGYVSYVRGEKPFIFPFRIYPKNSVLPDYKYYISGKKIENDKRLKYTKIILCEMKNIQSHTYLYYLKKKIKEGKIKENIDNESDENIEYSENESNNKSESKEEENQHENKSEDEKKNMGLLYDLTKISNIIFPISNTNNSNNNISPDIGSFTKSSIDTNYDNGFGGYYKVTNIIGSKKVVQYRYQSHAIFNKDTNNEAPFADEKHLENYSTKFYSALKTIKNSTGLILVFSQFIEQGALSFALMLEQNGFDRECSEGEYKLLDYNANKLKKGGKRKFICYKCGHDASYIDHFDEKSSNYHVFKRAKYILCIGESKDIVKVKKEEALKKFRDKKNMYGEEIKVIIGTRIISEGLDFKYLRQVHILEPWYNLSRHEQLIGRAIRYLSHKDLPPDEHNVEIYQYASILKKKNDEITIRESVDLKNYRIAENKDIIIKNITRIMKESSVDCVLFRNSNIITSDKKIKQISSSGEVLYIPFADKPYSAMCDYKENCNYLCNWMPNPRVKYPINTDTYNIRFASNDIEKIKKSIKNMFRENIVYYLANIENHILERHKNVDKLFIYTALEELVNNKNEIIYDKFSRKGYMIYRGDYYIFQPFDLERDELPMLYRDYPTSTVPDNVSLEDIEVNYNENSKIISNEKLNENKIINNILESINNTYKLHDKIIENNSSKEHKNSYLYAVIGTIYDKLNKEYELIFVKNILIKYLQKSNENYIYEIIEYLNSKNILINYYAHIIFDKSKIKEKLYVGYIINKEYYILESICKTENIKSIKSKDLKFIICPKNISSKIKSYSQLLKNKKANSKNYNIIYGIIELDKKNNLKIFKIVDKSLEEVVLTKEKKTSKRSIIKGRICSTFQINKLIEIREKINMYKFDGKKRVDFICEDLEIYFRYKSIINNSNKIWFEDLN
jgi:superfamily II DNA or RNA helicase